MWLDWKISKTMDDVYASHKQFTETGCFSKHSCRGEDLKQTMRGAEPQNPRTEQAIVSSALVSWLESFWFETL